MRVAFRVLAALAFSAVAFVIGLYLPLFSYWAFHGDPGMPGGAALALMGFPIGLTGALAAGFFSFVKLRGRNAS
jgi:hypothetical protein